MRRVSYDKLRENQERGPSPLREDSLLRRNRRPRGLDAPRNEPNFNYPVGPLGPESPQRSELLQLLGYAVASF